MGAKQESHAIDCLLCSRPKITKKTGQTGQEPAGDAGVASETGSKLLQQLKKNQNIEISDPRQKSLLAPVSLSSPTTYALVPDMLCP